MSLTIPSVEPAELIVGDTWTWQKSLGDFPAGTWTLTYYLRSQEGEISFSASASGTDHLVSVAKATTATKKAGYYSWLASVTDGTSRVTVGTGHITIKPDPAATGAGFDARSHARKVLEAVEAVIEGRATIDQQEYSIGNRMLKRMPIEDLLSFRNYYRGQVAAEEMGERARRGQGGNRLVVKL